MAAFATRNQDDALDIVQDAMLRLAKKYAASEADEWPPLFFRILQRRIVDWHRRQRLRRAIFGTLGIAGDDQFEDFDNVADPGSETPEAIVEHEQSQRRYEIAVSELPLRQQQVYLLREMQGFDVRQTAEIMQCSSGTVKTHLSRAREALQSKLEDLNG